MYQIVNRRFGGRATKSVATAAGRSSSTNGHEMPNEVLSTIFCLHGAISFDGEILSLDGTIFAGTFGDPAKLVGQNILDTVFWQTSETNFRLLADAIADAQRGLTSKTILEFRRSKEEKSILELTVCPAAAEPDERPPTILLYGQDVTAREREIKFYKSRSEHLLYAAESADVGLWFWDLSDGVIFSTPKCNEFFELDQNAVLEYPKLLDVVHPDDRRYLVKVFTTSQETGDEYEVEYRVIGTDGEIQWLSTKGRTYFDESGTAISMMGVVRRITDRKTADGELTRAHELERRARDAAEEANRTKDSFLALVSHELRTPLNAVLGWTKILLTKDVDDTTRRSALETIERSALSQAKLISDLVDSSRIASGKLRLEMRQMNLYESVKAVCEAQRPIAEAKQIKLRFEAESLEASVFGDTVRLQQVFNNLLSNAIKFTQDGGSVQVTLTTEADRVSVIVEDNGAGIKAESLPFIFRQFAQGDDSRTRDQNGLGLGLSIVKTLVEKHQGSVTAHSAGENCGSLFIVCLPLIRSQRIFTDTCRRGRNRPENELAGLRLLCVEDDADSREVLHLFLEQNGAKVESVDSAGRALQAIEAADGAFDALISDLAMPDEDGYTMIARVRDLPAGQGGSIPAIALSAFSSCENRERALTSGFQKYHTKPFSPDLLIDEIVELVRPTAAS